MSTNQSNSYKTHSIEANDDLVKSVIVDQTDNLEKGFREGFQNIVDSDASEGSLRFNSDFTLIADNGSGVKLTEQTGIDLLTVMGESSKDADDHSTIGEFGIGAGQIIAKGQTVFVSGETVLMFDIKNWGLEAKTAPLSNAAQIAGEYSAEWANLIDTHFGSFSHYDGLSILVNHYESEVPDENSYKWDNFENDIINRFRYLGSVKRTRLKVNGKLITDNDPLEMDPYASPKHTEVYETESLGEVHIAVKHGHGNLTVFSGGIKVTDVNSRGLSGRIVTENNLELNFARNEIKSGCNLWNEVRERLNDIREEMFNDYNGDLNIEARTFIAEQMFNQEKKEEFSEKEIFETASEDMVSYEDIVSEDEIGMSTKGNSAADKLEEAFGKIVLNKNDNPVEKFDDSREDLDEAPPNFDAEARAEAEGLHVSYEMVSENTLKSTKKKQLGIARYIVSMMEEDIEVKWGKSDVAAAWTDGKSEIVLTNSAAPASSWIQWVPQVWRVMMHELSHNVPSKESPGHGVGYRRRFRQNIEDDGGIESLTELLGMIDEKNLTEVAELGHMEVSDSI